MKRTIYECDLCKTQVLSQTDNQRHVCELGLKVSLNKMVSYDTITNICTPCFIKTLKAIASHLEIQAANPYEKEEHAVFDYRQALLDFKEQHNDFTIAQLFIAYDLTNYSIINTLTYNEFNVLCEQIREDWMKQDEASIEQLVKSHVDFLRMNKD